MANGDASHAALEYGNALAFLDEATNVKSAVEHPPPSTECVCQQQPCRCQDLETVCAKGRDNALARSIENRDDSTTTTGFTMVADWTLPGWLISCIELLATFLFVLSLSAINGVLLFYEYVWLNQLPLCESHFFEEFWSKYVAGYMGFPTCFGGLGLDPWEWDNAQV